MKREQIIEKLALYGQEHLLRYEDELSEKEKEAFYQQIMDTDFDLLKKLGQKEEEKKERNIEGLDCLEADAIKAKEDIYRK